MAVIAKTTRDWEGTFGEWSKPPGKTEQERCERAKKAIEDAIESDTTLEARSVQTFVQGSYCNRTNVRQDSDVDVCVLCEDVFFYKLPEGVTPQQVGLTSPATYKFEKYKNDVERALINKFGHNSVSRGNKAFNISKNSSRVDADAAPCFSYRLYRFYNPYHFWYYEGTALIADNTEHLLTNFPQQQYDNGVSKNNVTNRRFKKAVRIIKKLSNEMEDVGYTSAKNMSSFLIENLVWNSDNRWFDSQSLRAMTKSILAHLWKHTVEDITCKNWTEENGVKPLFRSTQKWKRTQVNQFLWDAWHYVENG